jgi:TusA-related sulfurtransferase
MPEQAVLASLISALSARDFSRFGNCLAPAAQARLLLPRGPEAQYGREDIVRRFEGWFSRATDFEVLETRREPVGHRNMLSWRFRMSRDGESKEVIEQVAFVDVGPQGISAIDLVCSGFMKVDSPAEHRVLDAGSMGCADGLAQEFRNRLADINVGDSIAVIVSDPAAKEDLPSLARLLGHSVRSVETKDDDRLVITVEKRK